MNTRAPTDGAILIIDDEACNIRFLERLLRRNGYTRIHATTCPKEGLEIFASTTIDLVLLDLSMPGMDGFTVMEHMKRTMAAGDYVPVLVLTGNPRPEVRNQALAGGARDFLAKPFDPSEALLRIENLLDTRHLQRTLALHNETLEARVRERTRELEDAQLEILSRLAMVAEYYDDDTAEHTRRVSTLSERLALELGVPQDEATLLGRAALLHDVGKIAVPAGLTRKPGRLSADERDLMQRHALEGARVLSGSRLPLMQVAEEVARSHHERWDGLGYPDGLQGDAIPLTGRIVSVADVYDALTNARPYKHAWTSQQALEEIRSLAGIQFDAAVVEALERIVARDEPAPTPTTTEPQVAGEPEVEETGKRAADRTEGAAAAARRAVMAAALLTLVVAGPASALAQQTGSVRGEATLTIAPLARITTVTERVVETADGHSLVELAIGVRANTSYRLSLTVPPGAPEDLAIWIGSDGGGQELRRGQPLVVAVADRGERLHTVTVRVSNGVALAPHLVFQVDVG